MLNSFALLPFETQLPIHVIFCNKNVFERLMFKRNTGTDVRMWYEDPNNVIGFPVLSRAYAVASLALWRGSVDSLLVSSQTSSQPSQPDPSLVQFCQKTRFLCLV